jgi:hypothetical protein
MKMNLKYDSDQYKVKNYKVEIPNSYYMGQNLQPIDATYRVEEPSENGDCLRRSTQRL